MFNIFRKLKSYNLILFLILGFCLTSQISISCEAQFLKKEKIVIENKLSKNKEFFLVELAKNEYEKKKGLQCKKYLKKNEGMLFIWSDEDYRSFWMKNTRIPLDIGYFSSNGTLLEIHKAKPYDTSGVPSKSSDIKFVLELNVGGFKHLNIPIGSRIDLDDITELINLRNLNPKDFNLP